VEGSNGTHEFQGRPGRAHQRGEPGDPDECRQLEGRVSFGSSGAYASVGGGGVRVGQRLSGPSATGRSATGRTFGSRPSLAQLERAQRAAEKEAAIVELQDLENSLVSLHHEDFAPAAPDEVHPPDPVDVEALRAGIEQHELSRIGRFKLSERKAAKARARQLADVEASRINGQNAERYRELCAVSAELWRLLNDHDTGLVMETLEGAFTDNASDATAVDVGTEDVVRYATVLVVFGAVDSVPERMPSLTAAGKPTTRKRTKSERNALYVAALGSTVLATVKEGLAVAPSVDEFRVVALRKDLNAATPADFVAPIYAARFPRPGMQGLSWRTVNPTEALLFATDAQFQRKGAAGDVAPLKPAGNEDLAQLVERFRPAILG
jgi:hypothetical protein